MSSISNIIDELHGKKSTQFGFVSESRVVDEDKWVTIKGTHVLLDDKGEIKNEKLKDKIESTSKKSNSKGTGTERRDKDSSDKKSVEAKSSSGASADISKELGIPSDKTLYRSDKEKIKNYLKKNYVPKDGGGSVDDFANSVMADSDTLSQFSKDIDSFFVKKSDKKVSNDETKKESESGGYKVPRKKASEINKMSRDERIKYGKDLTKELTGGRSAIERSDATSVVFSLSPFRNNTERQDQIRDDLMTSGGFQSRYSDDYKKYEEKFKKEVSPYIDKVNKARNSELEVEKKLNLGKDKMTDRELKKLEKGIKDTKKAFDDLEEVLRKYGVRSKHWDDVDDPDSDDRGMFI